MTTSSVSPSDRSRLPAEVHAGSNLLIGGAALIAAALAMSVSPTMVRLADVGPFASAFWRVFLALPILWVWMRKSEAALPATAPRARFPLATVLAGLVFTGDLFFWHLAIMHTTIANATFFATMAPLWVVIFGWLLFRQRVSRAMLAGLGLCLVGGGTLVFQSFTFRPDHLVGDALGIATGVCFGLYFLAVGFARRRSTAARVTFELSLITAPLLFVVAYWQEPRLLPHSLFGAVMLCSLAWISHAGGQGLLSIALGRLPTAFSSLVIFIEAIAAAVFAWAVLNEAVSLPQAIGGVIIITGIWIARPRAASSVTSPSAEMP